MGLVAHPVFKTGRAEQPSAWKVRFLRRSVAVASAAWRWRVRGAAGNGQTLRATTTAQAYAVKHSVPAAVAFMS